MSDKDNETARTHSSYGSTWDDRTYEHFVSLHSEHSSPASDHSLSGSTHSNLSAWLWTDEKDMNPIGWNCLRHNVFDIITVKVLGFESNPCREKPIAGMHDNLQSEVLKNSSEADMRLSMLSNFSTSYNILSVSLALHIMNNIYEMDDEDRSLCSSALLAGMILGQLGGGAIGDAMGRHQAMVLVMFFQIFAAIGSALSCDVDVKLAFEDSIFQTVQFSVFKVLAGWRFILGLGCGGVYPLAATLTAESSTMKEDRAKLVALTFSMQGIGYLAVPLFAWILIYLLGEESDLSWRLLLGVGTLPGVILTINRRSQQRTKQTNGNDEQSHVLAQQDSERGLRKESIGADLNHQTIWEAIRSEDNLVTKMIGTAGCWFLFDVLYYGNTLFQPIVLEAIFGNSETIQKTARDTAIIALLALPGYFVSVAVVGYQSPKYIQIQGFILMAVLYAIIGVFFSSLASYRPLLLLLYGASFFFSDYGPNCTTFMLPSMTFSPSCRSTLNGICAASGKLGALLGATMFEPTAREFGSGFVMLLCSVLSLCGACMTVYGIESNTGLGSSHAVTGKKKKTRNTTYRPQSAPSLFDLR